MEELYRHTYWPTRDGWLPTKSMYGRVHIDGWRKEPTKTQRSVKRAKSKASRKNKQHMRRMAHG